MPYCAILECKNDSRMKNLSKGGVSYHRFPKDPTRKYDWITATGRISWMPVTTSTICSEHFSEKEFLLTKQGRRFLKTSAVPTLNVVTFFDKVQSPMNASTSQETPTDSETDTVPQNKKSLKTKISKNAQLTETSSSQRNQNLKRQLRWSKEKIKNQHLKIRRLQALNRKLKEKITNLRQILETLM